MVITYTMLIVRPLCYIRRPVVQPANAGRPGRCHPCTVHADASKSLPTLLLLWPTAVVVVIRSVTNINVQYGLEDEKMMVHRVGGQGLKGE